MGIQTWGEVLAGAVADGPTVTGVSQTSIIPVGAVWTMPANWLYVGRKLLIKANGRITTDATAGNITWTVRIAGSINAFTSANLPMKNSITTMGWELELMLTCRTIGNAAVATLFGNGRLQGELTLGSAAPATSGSLPYLLQHSAPAVGTGFNSVQANTVDLMATMDNTGNTLICHDYTLLAMN